MLKLQFEKSTTTPITKFEVYNSINRVPFKIFIKEYFPSLTSAYTSNYFEKNFINLWFDKNTHTLYEISLLTFNNNYRERVTSIPGFNEPTTNDIYIIKLNASESILEDNLSMKTYRTVNSIGITIGDPQNLKYFLLAQDICIGIDNNSFLKSIVLKNLSSETIVNILGL